MARSIRIYGDKEGASRCIPEAKRLLYLLKSGNVNKLSSVWHNRYLADGSFVQVSSIFGNDYISITSPIITEIVSEEIITLLFLVSGVDSYAVFRIGSNGSTLTPYQFDLSKYITKFSIPGWYNKASIVTSEKDDDYDSQHTFIVDDLYNVVVPTGGFTWERWGTHNDAGYSGGFAVFGLRNSYVYPNWDISVNKVFDTDLSYLSHPQYSSPPYPLYICSGRHNWMVKENILMKNMELWCIAADTAQLWWYQEDGLHEGTAFSIDTGIDIKFYIAIIGENKFIRKIIGDYYYSGEDQNGTLYVKSGDRYVFGDVELFACSYDLEKIFSSPSIAGYCINFAGLLVEYYVQTFTWDRVQYGVVALQTYDHLDNDDKTFICFLCVTGTTYHESGYMYERIGPTSTSFGGTLRNFYLCYRLKGGALHRILLQFYGQTMSVGTTSTVNPSNCGIDVVTDYTTNSYIGRRVWNPSCKIEGKYIVYSYQIWVYTGPDPPTTASLNLGLLEAYWGFEKQIMGVIDIDTGTKTEYEVNDAFLGSYATTFNEEVAATIGIHKLVKEV